MRRLLCSASRPHLEWHRHTPKKVEGAPLLLIHGFACGKNNWGVLPRLLAAKSKREVITFDHQGLGASSPPSGTLTVSDIAADAKRVLDEAGIGSAAILGISLGGMAAQSLALEHPDCVSGLVLGCTTHGGREVATPDPSFLKVCQSWAEDRDPNSSPHVEQFIRSMLPATFLEQHSAPKLLEQFRTAFLEVPRSRAGMQGQLAAMGRFNSTKRLAEIACPTLIVTGDADAVMPTTTSESLARRIPGAELCILHGHGHFWWAESTAEVAGMISRFLQRCDGRYIM